VAGSDWAARILTQGLTAASLRQRVLAHNIANVSTPGFKRSRVEFETQLSDALRRGDEGDAVQPEVITEVDRIGRPDGNNVDVELEMTRMTENQLWYAALVRQLSDHYSRLRMVIHDGRR
jgi:flagellar basal-body rod protein FlgB